MTKDKLSPSQLLFLQKLNSLLAKKEKELFERCRSLFELYEKRLKENGGDLSDYEIDVIVEYYLAGNSPKYIYQPPVTKNMFEDSDWTFGSDEDWKEDHFPDLGAKWCYFMHCLYGHAKLGKSLYKIIRVDFEINIREQQLVSVVDHELFC